jgi:hypothetical protein
VSKDPKLAAAMARQPAGERTVPVIVDRIARHIQFKQMPEKLSE